VVPPHAGTIDQERTECPAPVRIAYRSLDRQWIIPDSRVIDFPRPELWRAAGEAQVFLSELHSAPVASGPAVTFAALVPDMHHFKDSEHIGSGEFAPVPAAVWDYDIGGMRVLRKWFSYRRANPGGRRSSPLDAIHADRWPHEWTAELIDLLTVLRRLVELEPQQEDLLGRSLTGPQITAADLTTAGVFPVPDVARRAHRNAPDLFS
jgi:hypothetical protein